MHSFVWIDEFMHSFIWKYSILHMKSGIDINSCHMCAWFVTIILDFRANDEN